MIQKSERLERRFVTSAPWHDETTINRLEILRRMDRGVKLTFERYFGNLATAVIKPCFDSPIDKGFVFPGRLFTLLI